MNCKLNFPLTIGICLILIFASLVYAHHKNKKNAPLSQIQGQQQPKNDAKDAKGVEEYYPYYPYLYKDKTSLILPNQTDFRTLGDGNLLVWNDTPINPLLVKCRKDDYQNEVCKYIIGNQSSIPTSP